MGITRTGRFSAVTNYWDQELYRENKLSRGQLVKNFLVSHESSLAYAWRIQECAAKYNPFNLVVCDTEDAVWVGYVPNRPCLVVRIEAGIHGVSNHLLNTPWPKLVRAKKRFQAGLSALPDHSSVSRVLQVREWDEGKSGVSGDIDHDTRKMMSSAFVVSEVYGTRSATVHTRSTSGQLFFEEVTYDRVGTESTRNRVRMTMERL
jgi:uncharacterized protein with NRDE domain